ncbi:hypothetical protein SCORR_v1c07810 [Spiroplasma corruscae]|uniref:Lipoprotein n=1 Tax=Spiroplasma corruscae TaxID=216934 RepID=A0A222EQN3_9MOLU|nr:hypothetical protein [Spiroplasma corruscae]ASP28553.1 hypothetical protein SCORR_v1c07810 [Spiroplasma corruscae]
MKKILKILFSITPLAFSSTLVSCGSNDNVNSANNGNVDGNGSDNNSGNNGASTVLLDLLKEEVNDAINKNLQLAVNNLYQLDKLNDNLQSTLSNEFLKYDKLKNYDGKSLTDTVVLSDVEKVQLIEDVRKLINFSKITEDVMKVYKKEVYKVYSLTGNDTDLFTLNINYNSVAIAFTSGEIKAANVLFDYNFDLYYKDSTNKKNKLSFNQRFLYGLTTNADLGSYVEKLSKSLKYDSLLDTSNFKDAFAISSAKLFDNDSRRYTGYIDESTYSGLLKNYINKNSAIGLIINGINDYMDNKTFKVELKNIDEGLFNNYYSVNKLGSEKAYLESMGTKDKNPVVWKSDDNKKIEGKNFSSQELYDYFFRENNILEQDTGTIGDVSGSTINKYIYDISKDSITSNLKYLYDKEVETISNLKDGGFELKDLQNNSNLYNNIKLGFLNIKNLTITLNSDFSQQLPQFDVLTSFKVTEKSESSFSNLAKETLSQDFFDKSNLFAYVYYNSRDGVKAMKAIFDFKEDTINERAQGIGKQPNFGTKGLSLTTFSGDSTKKGLSINKNLWDTFDLNVRDNSAAVNAKKMLNNLSLRNDSQVEYLNYMKTAGAQENYEWDFQGFNYMNLEYAPKDYSYRGFYLKYPSPFTNWEDYFYGNLKFNFINLSYVIDKNIYPNQKAEDVPKYYYRLNVVGQYYY